MTADASIRLLLVEDDLRTASLVREYLVGQGFVVDHEADGNRAAKRIIAEQPDLVLLDLMLPGKDGLTICREVRAAFTGAILMMTARGDEIDQVVGLELGADDYVTKPVGPRLLVARIRALLRRPGGRAVAPPERVEIGALVVDRTRREVSVAGRPVELTTAEFDLLWVLASRAGEVVSRAELFESLRGIAYDGIDRSIDMRVSAVRRRIERGRLQWIKTVRGEGYLLMAPEPEVAGHKEPSARGIRV